MRCSTVLIHFLFFSVSSGEELTNEEPLVSTMTGKISGLKEFTDGGKLVYKFLGVPYAEPPIGNLRLRDPLPVKPWESTLNATEQQNKCVQASYEDPNTPDGSEDCLYLNIYTPSLPNPGLLKTNVLKPVMFWIHGGGFVEGSAADYDPSPLLDKDVLVVSISYRLGPFGFLALENNPDLAGNFGLKDQQEALMWVHHNIRFFGGDPAKVTLFGESAGAVSVHAHFLSPRIKNIFQGGILQSGTALMQYAQIFIEKLPQKNSQEFVTSIGCDIADALECLQGKGKEELMPVGSEYKTLQYWMVQDSVSSNPVLPYNPLQQLMTGNVKKLPMIGGITKDDGGLILMIDTNLRAAFEENNSSQLIKSLGMEDQPEGNKLMASALRRFYTTEGSYDENKWSIIEMATDAWFGSPMAEVMKHHSKVARVFPYVLNERCTDFSFSSLMGGNEEDFGVTHADDLNCVFKPYPLLGELNESGKLTSAAMVTSWTNFAKFEDPSPYLSSVPSWPAGEMMYFEKESGIKKNESQHENLLMRNMFWDRMVWKPLEEKQLQTFWLPFYRI